MITNIVVTLPNWERKKIKTKQNKKNCSIDKLKSVLIEILLCSNFVEFNVLLFVCLLYHLWTSMTRFASFVWLPSPCNANLIIWSWQQKQQWELQKYQPFFLSIKAMSKDMDEFWVVLFFGKRKEEKRKEPTPT
jgi:hypothetical protein